MKRLLAAILTGLWLIAGPAAARADAARFPASRWTAEKTYMDKITGKLGFGFLNVLSGWSAVLFEPARPGNKFRALGKGLILSVTNTAGGLVHAATFPLPVDVPLPEGGIHFDV